LVGSLLLLTSIVGNQVFAEGGIRGDPEAVSRANALLEQPPAFGRQLAEPPTFDRHSASNARSLLPG
jgi:hypothetical protein